jgi:hypothetical protein
MAGFPLFLAIVALVPSSVLAQGVFMNCDVRDLKDNSSLGAVITKIDENLWSQWIDEDATWSSNYCEMSGFTCVITGEYYDLEISAPNGEFRRRIFRRSGAFEISGPNGIMVGGHCERVSDPALTAPAPR